MVLISGKTLPRSSIPGTNTSFAEHDIGWWYHPVILAQTTCSAFVGPRLRPRQGMPRGAIRSSETGAAEMELRLGHSAEGASVSCQG